MQEDFSILAAAGGTGGHLFPAIAVCQQLNKQFHGKVRAKFIGTADRMESEIVPKLGYEFEAIPIAGYTGISLKLLTLPFKIIRSIMKCRKIIRKFKPDAVLCTGAYISYPLGIAASIEKIPLIIMESNVTPGKTIKMLAPKASLIVASFEGSQQYYDENDRDRIEIYGNPVRENLLVLGDRADARRNLGLVPDKKTIFVFGGSLGAKSINEAVAAYADKFGNTNYQMIWQTGKNYSAPQGLPSNIKPMQFIDDMATCYAACDMVISRSGATTVAELAITGRPSVLVPLRTAANNEQEHNGKYLEQNGAAIFSNDDDIRANIGSYIDNILSDDNKRTEMARAAASLARPDAARRTVDKIREILKK